MNILIVKKDILNFLTLVNDFKKKKFTNYSTANSVNEAFLKLEEQSFDIVFIDLSYGQEPEGNKFFNILCQQYKIHFIFFQSYGQWTENGIEVSNPVCYYLKPFEDVTLILNNSVEYNLDEKKTIKKLIDNTYKLDKKNNRLYKLEDTFFVKNLESLTTVQISDVCYLENEKNYITIFLKDNKYLIRKTLQSVLEILPENFVKANRSTIVNLKKIKQLEGNRISLHDTNHKIIVSSKHKDTILEAIPLI